ncbi:hypothetical protein NPIL_567701, partial [Nephila pilipes]
ITHRFERILLCLYELIKLFF